MSSPRHWPSWTAISEEVAEGAGLEFHRIPIPHDDPAFAELLADLVEDVTSARADHGRAWACAAASVGQRQLDVLPQCFRVILVVEGSMLQAIPAGIPSRASPPERLASVILPRIPGRAV